MTGKYYVGAILLTGAALAATVVAYPHLPASVPTHWDIHGMPNGYSPKWPLYFIPVFMAAVIVATWKLPWLSPKHFEVDSFHGTYTQLMLIAIALLAYLDAAILWIGAKPLRIAAATATRWSARPGIP